MTFYINSKIFLLGIFLLAISTTARAQDSTLAIVYCEQKTFFNVIDSVFVSFCEDRYLSISDARLHFMRSFRNEDELKSLLKRKSFGNLLRHHDYFSTTVGATGFYYANFGATKKTLEQSALTKMNFVLVDSNKIILGYNCKAAKGELGDDHILLWYTNEIKPAAAKFWFPQSPGVVLEVEGRYKSRTYQFVANRIEWITTNLQQPGRKIKYKMLEN